VNQEESEQNEVEERKNGADSTGEVMPLTSDDECSRGDDLGEAGLYGYTTHCSSVEVWLRVVGDVGEPRYAAVVNGGTGSSECRIRDASAMDWRQWSRPCRQVERVRLVYSHISFSFISYNTNDNKKLWPRKPTRYVAPLPGCKLTLTCWLFTLLSGALQYAFCRGRVGQGGNDKEIGEMEKGERRPEEGGWETKRKKTRVRDGVLLI